MKCPKCRTSVTARELQCSGCGLLTPLGKHIAESGSDYDGPQWQEDLKRVGNRPVRLTRWALAAVLTAVVLLCGGASYWYYERGKASERLPDPQEDAVMIVMKSACAQGGTIDDRLGKIIEDLARKKTLEDLTGWAAAPVNGQTCRVVFIYKESGYPEQVFEWVVNLNQRTIRPENNLARHITD